MSSPSKPRGRGDVEKVSMDIIWMETEQKVKSVATAMKEKLHAFREHYRKANYDAIKECNKLFIKWNEELLSLCKSNRRSYYMESRTEKLDRQRLEDQMIIAQKEEEIEKLRKEFEEEREGKDIALNRLSELQSHLLKFGNPEIADLSNKNRPTNLGEQYKELYANEWTDMFEVLTEQNESGDQQAIDILYAMFKSCSELCSESVSKQYRTLAGLVTDPLHAEVSETVPPDAGSQDKATSVVMQAVDKGEQTPGTNKADIGDVVHGKVEVAVKEFSKSIAEESIKNADVAEILKLLNKEQQFPEDLLQNDCAKEYLEKSFKLCWLMQTQHPPMVIDFTPVTGTVFDANVFDSYTTRGPKVEQVVWPPLYLHEGGPLVSKGVAQGKKD